MKNKMFLAALIFVAPLAKATSYYCAISDGLSKKQDLIEWNYLKTINILVTPGLSNQIYIKGNLGYYLSAAIATRGPNGPKEGEVAQITVLDLTLSTIVWNATTDLGGKVFVEDYQNQVAVNCSAF